MGVVVPLPLEVAAIYAAVRALEARYPGRKFTPDGHLVGSIGEAIAAEQFGLELLPNSSAVHDARAEDGSLVQIKLTGGLSISMYANCERLLVMRIATEATAELVYYGEGQKVWDACGPVQKNGQRTIRLSKLRQLS
ncbi:DUF6998 domain-containing protein [Devosia sp.]|uniref:DUF6998 domain-containing protein n=1 Tax=Devosia sp. TaxID=1871048 RepID=UPI003BAA01F9